MGDIGAMEMENTASDIARAQNNRALLVMNRSPFPGRSPSQKITVGPGEWFPIVTVEVKCLHSATNGLAVPPAQRQYARAHQCRAARPVHRALHSRVLELFARLGRQPAIERGIECGQNDERR